LEVFGLEGRTPTVLDAHITALAGDPATFTLKGDRISVRCRVGPVTDGLGKMSGTYCVATHIDGVDVREEHGATRRRLRGLPGAGQRSGLSWGASPRTTPRPSSVRSVVAASCAVETLHSSKPDGGR
jgi:hypothetical protein